LSKQMVSMLPPTTTLEGEMHLILLSWSFLIEKAIPTLRAAGSEGGMEMVKMSRNFKII